MTDFELAEETDEQPADDEEQADEADADETEDPADLDASEEEAQSSLDEDSDTDEVYLEWADEYGVHEDGTLPLREAVEENGRIFLNAANEWQLEDAQEEIEGLRGEVAELREENQNLRERVETLESWRGGTASTVNRNLEDINRLAAAVFDNEPPCPECDDGHLEADTGGFGSDTIACSECEYEEQMG